MTALRVFLARLLGRGRTPSELDSEIAAHLALLAADYERRGLSRTDAMAAARRHFGPITQLRETYRDQRRLPFLDTLSQDLAYALFFLALPVGPPPLRRQRPPSPGRPRPNDCPPPTIVDVAQALVANVT